MNTNNEDGGVAVLDGETLPLGEAFAPPPAPKGPDVGTFSTFQLQDKVVLLLLTLRAPGNERTVSDKSILDTNADRERLHIGKRLLDCEQQKWIAILDGQIRQYVARMALPTPFKAGTHVIALDLLGMLDGKLSELAVQRRAAVEAFADVYDLAKLNAKEKLGDLFDEDEYMGTNELKAAYRMTWQYVTLTAPDRMKGISSTIFERERKRLEAQWNDAIGDMRDALRVGLAELVDDMVQRLAGDGKKAKPTKLLERFTEFLDTFDARNVTNDQELTALAKKARELLSGVDTDALKKSAALREQVREGFQAAQQTLGQLEIGAKAQRRIDFDAE